MDFVRKHPVLAAIIAAIATAALLLAGDGMNPVWPLMWIAFLPVLLLAAETTSWLLAGGAAAVSMLLGSLNFLRYMHFALGAPVTAWLLPFSIASLLFAAGVVLFRALLRRGASFLAVVALPAFWALTEYLASFVPANGTAGSLAYTQERFLPILQIASLTGPWGITFLLLLFPSAVVCGVHLWHRRRARAAAVIASAAAVLAIAVLFGAVRLATPVSQQTIKVGLLVTDRVFFAEDPAEMQELVEGYAEQAGKLSHAGATIVVMPEKIGLIREQNAQMVDHDLQTISDRTRATLVIGVKRVTARESLNEARIYTPDHPIATYDKEHMVPLFESDLAPGRSLTLWPDPAGVVGVAICKDMDFIHPALNYGRAGVALLVVPAWDFNVDRTWHGHIAIMRGVEGGYAVARAAKDGFLTVSDDRGRILGEVRSDSAAFASLLVDVPMRRDSTVFTQHPTWFPWLMGLILLATLLHLLRKPHSLT